MIFTTKTTLLSLVAVVASFSSNMMVDATCTTYYYQSGSSSVNYWMMAFDHNDGTCSIDSPYSKSELHNGEWISVQANKNHKSTIQNKLMWKDGGDFYKATDFKTCDGISHGSMCDFNTAYKATCNKHYIWYPEDQKMCEAQEDENGDLVLDDDDKPVGDCSSCSGNDVDDLWRNLRGKRKLN